MGFRVVAVNAMSCPVWPQLRQRMKSARLAFLLDAHLPRCCIIKDLVDDLYLCIVVACPQRAHLEKETHFKAALNAVHLIA